MSNNKTLKVFSSTAVAGMIAAAMMSSQAFAAVDAYSVKVGDEVFKYDKAQLEKAFLDSKAGEKSALYDDFTKKLTDAKGFYAFNDTKNGYVDYSSIEAKFLEAKNAGTKFDVNAFTESKDAKVVEVKAAKKVVVNKDGKVEYVAEDTEDVKGELQIKEVKPLNLKQVKIEFNKAVTDQDKIDDIEDEDNYTWENSDRDELKDVVDKVEMDESGKFAIITFKDDFESDGKYIRPVDTDKGIVNQELYKLTIDENVTGKEVTKEVKFDDAERPEVKDIVVVGNDTIKVKFSEPVMPDKKDNSTGKSLLNDEDFKINNDNTAVNEAELVNNNTEANIKLGTNLKDGEEIKVEVRGVISDYAGFGMKIEEKTIKVKEDTERPEVVSAKKIKKGEVTLVFNKDIKLKGTDDKFLNRKFFDEKGNIKENIKSSEKQDSLLDEYYHTNTKDKAYAVKIDGKELTMYFDEDEDGIPNGPVTFSIKSGEIETLWKKDNAKVMYSVQREADTTKPEVKSVEQDEDDASVIKIKFNKELDRDEAEKKDNYEIKDENGNKVTIKGNIRYNNSDKEVKITTNKKLDNGEYKVTIKKVEDKYGNVMKEVTKKFKGTEKDARTSEDIKVNVYNAGENKQKIVVDFDTKMKTTGEYSVTDLSKYSLVAKNGEKVFKGDKSSVSISELYNKKIRSIDNGKKVEIDLPFKKDKDDSYNLTFKDGKYVITRDGKDHSCTELELHIGKVSDIDGNVNDISLVKSLSHDGTIDVDDNNGDRLVRAVSTDEIQVTFKDSMNVKNDDFKVYAVPQKIAKEIEKGNDKHKGCEAEFKKALKEKAEDIKEVSVSQWNNYKNDDGNTYLSMKLSKNPSDKYADTLSKRYDDSDFDHVLNYDGTIGKNHDVLFVSIEGNESKNDYDAKLTTSVHRVLDNIAPTLVDNNKRDDSKGALGKFEGTVATVQGTDGYSVFGNKDNGDEAVECYNDGAKGAIVLTFEEAIDPNSVGKNTFTLDTDDDYKYVKVDGAYVSEKDPTKVIIEVSGLDRIEGDSVFGDGFDVIQNAPIRDVAGTQFIKGEGNQVEGIKTQVGDFTQLTAKVAKAIGVQNVSDTKIQEEAQKQVIGKLQGKSGVKVEDKTVTITVKNDDTAENLLKDTFKDVTLDEIKQSLSENDKEAIKKSLGVASYDAMKDMKAEDIVKKLSDLKLESGYEFKLVAVAK